MTRRMIIITIATVLFLGSGIGHSQDKETFSTDKLISDLNSKIELSKEQWEKLKPLLDEKSDALKKSIEEYADKGSVYMGEMSDKLKDVSKDTEKKLEAFLNSAEVDTLKRYLDELDKEAVKQAKDKMVAELTEILELTEDQAKKLKPALEDGMEQLTILLEDLAKKGRGGWEEFKKQYKALTEELKQKFDDTLNEKQMQKFEEYKQDKQDTIEMALATV